MGCGCNNKIDPELALRLHLEQSMCEPTGWGPIVWKYLHSLVERLGNGNDEAANADEANYFNSMIKMLPLIIPCRKCQKHATTYMTTHPLPHLKILRGAALRNAAREWLFLFHSAVREQNEQPVIVGSVEECQVMYTNGTITQAEYTQFIHCVAAASRNGWVLLENWRKWYNFSERLRQMVGNVIV